MAKSKSFFGLRRGSTKSMTFQVLNGAQITKDRVVDVKNPRTRTQMVQRMIMATAGSAYKHMREIVDHSFEGVSYGQRSYSEFMRLNVHDMVEDVRGDLGQFSYNPFGDTGLYPGPFIIARGSLKYNSALAGFYEEPNTVNVQLPTLASDNDKPSVSEQAAAWGLQLGDVLTFAFIYQTSVNNTWGFGFLRIMFRKESDSELNEDSFRECFDIDSSLPVSVSGYIDNNYVITLETPVDDELDVFGTTILSRRSNSRWLRSNAQIIFPGSPVNSPTAAEALATYPIGTDYILNGASIGGGGIAPDTRLRMVTRFTNGSPVSNLDENRHLVASFNRPITVEDMSDGLAVVYFSESENNAFVLTSFHEEEMSNMFGMTDDSGRIKLVFEVEGSNLYVNAYGTVGWVFDIDFNNQHRRPFNKAIGSYYVDMPLLVQQIGYYPIFTVNYDLSDFDIYVDSKDEQTGYLPMAVQNAQQKAIVNNWVNVAAGLEGYNKIMVLMMAILKMEYDEPEDGFAYSERTGEQPHLIGAINFLED